METDQTKIPNGVIQSLDRYIQGLEARTGKIWYVDKVYQTAVNEHGRYYNVPRFGWVRCIIQTTDGDARRLYYNPGLRGARTPRWHVAKSYRREALKGLK
jgi:hypothetical protein